MRFLAGSAVMLACGAAGAAIVTSPAGVVNGPYSDTPALDAWQRMDIRATATVGITGDYPNPVVGGNGSVLMTSGDGSGKTTWQYFPAGGLGPLSSFTSATYQWYRDAAASSTTDHFHPVFRIRVDEDGDPATTDDQSWLVYERGAIGGASLPIATDAWVTETIDDNTRMWVWQTGANNSQNPNLTMAQYKAGDFQGEDDGWPIDPDSTILGIQVGTGSGWTGTFRGAVDNIGIVVGENSLGPDNFELAPPPPPPVAATPVPALDVLGLLGLSGLLAGFAAWRQRRRG